MGHNSFLPSKETTPFVILCYPRTGSTLLVEMLDSHPDILCHAEIFNPKSTYLSRKPHLNIGTKEERDRDPWTFLKNMYAEVDGASIVGFKIMPNHNNRIMLSLLLSRRVKKIVVTRDNWLQTYVSNLIAFQTNEFIAPKSGPRMDSTPQVEVDLRAFRRYLRKVRAFFSILSVIHFVTRQTFFKIDYSEMKDSSTTKRLLAFLGAEPGTTLQERTKRQNVSSLRQKVSNYDEIAAAVRGSRLEKFLDD